MAQLKMYWVKGTPIKKYDLPAGYSFSHVKDDNDRLAWVECCKNGLVDDDSGLDVYDDRITTKKDCVEDTDVFFLDHEGKHVGTITAIYHPDRNCGEVHMVGIITEYRGKGLGKYMNSKALEKLAAQDVKYIFLTTDEWRKGAVKSYLSAGFQPVEYDEGMEERWSAVLEEYGIDSVDMVDENASFYKTVYRSGLNK